MSFVSAKSNKDIETRGMSATQDTPQKHNTKDTGWNCPAHASPRMQGNSVPFCAQRGLLLHSPLPCSNVTSPARNAQLWSPPSRPFPAPVPQLSFWTARSLNPSLTTSMLANWDVPAVNRSASSPEKEKKRQGHHRPHMVLTVSITLAKTNLFHNNPLLRSTRMLCCSLVHSRVGHCSHNHLCNLRCQDTQNDHCTREKSPALCSSLPPQLTSRACPMPKAAPHSP